MKYYQFLKDKRFGEIRIVKVGGEGDKGMKFLL